MSPASGALPGGHGASTAGVDAVLALLPPWGLDFPPLGLASLATATRARGHALLVRDLNIECYASSDDRLRAWWEPERLKYWAPGERLEEIWRHLTPLVQGFLEAVAAARPALVGLSTNEANLPFTLRVVRLLRERLPAVCIVLGGPGISWPADRARLQGEPFTGVLVGEGEERFPLLIEAARRGLPLDEVAGFERPTAEPRMTPLPALAVQALEELPTPLFDDFPLAAYRTPQLPLLFGRSCVNRCVFCNDRLVTPRYRCKSASKLLAEVRLYQERHGTRDFQFNDLLINASPRRLRRFAELVLEGGLAINYSGQAVIDRRLDDEVLGLLARSGCRSLVFGVESFSDEVLQRMGKGYSVAEARQVLEGCRRSGIRAMVNLIVGFPGETEEAFRGTMDWLRVHRELIERVSALSTCIITPQCELEREPDRFDIVLPRPEHWCQWYTRDGTNTYEVRARRQAEMMALLGELGLTHQMTNRYLEMVEE